MQNTFEVLEVDNLRGQYSQLLSAMPEIYDHRHRDLLSFA